MKTKMPGLIRAFPVWHPGWRYVLLFAGAALEAIPLGKAFKSFNHGGWEPTVDASVILLVAGGIACMVLFRKTEPDDLGPTNRRRSRARRILGSCVCGLAGWIGFLSLMFLLLLCAALARNQVTGVEDIGKGL